jgi:glyoxylase-like metal-dependent hydrolase (beta-lactamase superfamily II)
MLASRREFLLAAGLATGSLLVRGRAAAGLLRADDPPTFFKWQSLSEDAWVGFGQGGNTLVLMGKSSAALVDCKNAPFGATLRREAEALGAPIKLVVNTHHHADHTGGNHAFSKNLPIVAHEKCKPRIAGNMNRYISAAKEAVLALTDDKNPAAAKVRDEAKAYHDRMNDLKAEEFEPKMTVGESRELEVGGQKLVLRHFGPGHTDNDLAVFVPKQNLVHAGDLLFHKNHPFLDADGGGSVQGWISSVKQVIELCDPKTRVIPGHGEMTDVSGLRQQITYWEVTCEAVAKAIKEGRSRGEASKLELDQFKDYGLTQIRQMTLGAVYDELKNAAKNGGGAG